MNVRAYGRGLERSRHGRVKAELPSEPETDVDCHKNNATAQKIVHDETNFVESRKAQLRSRLLNPQTR
jgi:hypothetical protein